MSRNKDNRKVVITHLPLSKPKEEVFTIVKRSRLLINSICEYSKELRKRGIKIFERSVNIIRTEEGYYCAFYEEDIEQFRTGKKEFPKPFMGLDGRMKVALEDKNGNSVVEDLAILVATSFVPNPNNYKNVLFKDKDPNNCKAENLFWSEI